jgi:hypothetical protein
MKPGFRFNPAACRTDRQGARLGLGTGIQGLAPAQGKRRGDMNAQATWRVLKWTNRPQDVNAYPHTCEQCGTTADMPYARLTGAAITTVLPGNRLVILPCDFDPPMNLLPAHVRAPRMAGNCPCADACPPAQVQVRDRRSPMLHHLRLAGRGEGMDKSLARRIKRGVKRMLMLRRRRRRAGSPLGGHVGNKLSEPRACLGALTPP